MEFTETIGGYRVHPAASIFPLLSGDDFNGLVESIRDKGVLVPVVVLGDILIDGRNRLLAVERLRSEGWAGECPIQHWSDGEQSIAGWIHDVNIKRRNLTEDAAALASAAVYKLIAAENEERRKAAQFNCEKAKQAADKRHAARTESYEPQKRDTKTENARSTIGQVAAKAGVSHHKASQAVAVQKGVESGDVPAEAVQEVMRGEKRLRDVLKPHVTNNSGENEWYTPPQYIVAAREVMGEIDLDPASSKAAQKQVQATTFYTKDDDGLQQEWRGRVWMNPPYSGDLVGKFTEKLADAFDANEVTTAIVLVNNATESKWFQRLASSASAICFPKGRIKYLDSTGTPANSPLQGQAILYFGGDVSAFAEVFQQFGFITEVRYVAAV